MRVGQKNKLTYRWARKGSRPRAAHDQRTQSTYLFGAVGPEHGTGAALVLPFCNTEAMQLHLDEIAARVIVKIGYQTESSNPSTTLSITAAAPGTPSSINPGKSCRSHIVIGQSSVTQSEDWY
jgi:hypothetical protein